MRSHLWDKLGALAGAVCAVHCLLTGVALGLLGVLGLEGMASPVVDWSFVAIALGLGVWAVVHGVRLHRSWVPASFFLLGMLLILASRVEHMRVASEPHHEHTLLGTWLSIGGGLCLVAFHLANIWLQRRHDQTCRCGRGVCGHPPKRQP